MTLPTIDLLEAIATARSIRRYLPDPVPEDVLAKILWAGTRAPSGTNRQPFRFIVLRSSETAREIKSLMGAAFRRGWGHKSSAESWGKDGDAGALDATRAIDGSDAALRRSLRGDPGGGARLLRALPRRRSRRGRLGLPRLPEHPAGGARARLRRLFLGLAPAGRRRAAPAPRHPGSRRALAHDHDRQAGRQPRSAAPLSGARADLRGWLGARGGLGGRSARQPTSRAVVWSRRRSRRTDHRRAGDHANHQAGYPVLARERRCIDSSNASRVSAISLAASGSSAMRRQYSAVFGCRGSSAGPRKIGSQCSTRTRIGISVPSACVIESPTA